VLERGEETQLKHCSGMELWLAKWVVENADGTLDFTDEGDVKMRITLQQAVE